MSQWATCQSLRGPLLEQVKQLYGPRFPIEVRHYLANWIEAQSWSEIDPDNNTHELNGRRLFEAMLLALQELIATYSDNFITKTQLESLFTHMKNEYIQRPLELVRVVQVCLITEAELVRKQEELSIHVPSQVQSVQKVQQNLQNIISKTMSMETMFRMLTAKHESFQIHYQESCSFEMTMHQVPTDQLAKYKERKILLDQIINRDIEEINHIIEDLIRRFHECLEDVGHTHNVVAEELSKWKQSQRWLSFEDGSTGHTELNNIQKWFESLAEILWRLRQLAKQLEIIRSRLTTPILQQQDFVSITQHVTKLLVDLIIESFILEKQPPQVIKTSNRFSATVRLLVGSKLQIHLSVPEVTATIINKNQAKALLMDPSNCFSSGEILNNQKSMEFNAQTGVLQCNFNYMQLRRIKRNTDKKATEIVMEEKFTLLFKAKFVIAGGELEIPVMCQSLPVVVIVHVTQQPAAEATIFWDNAFAEASREPFVVPEVVPWIRLSEALDFYFQSHTGRGLTSRNLKHLGHVLLGAGKDDDMRQMSVTRQQMCRGQLKARTFTFWEWFYKHLDLIKTTLKREWVEGLIEGFMDKDDAHDILMQEQGGTFLIRFSDSETGGVSITWVSEDESGNKQLVKLAPWGKHDLSIRSLANRLHDLSPLVVLYPSKLKDDVFKQYYSPQAITVRDDGYMVSDICVQLPGGVVISNPASPAPSLYSFTDKTPSPTSPFPAISETFVWPQAWGDIPVIDIEDVEETLASGKPIPSVNTTASVLS